MSGRTWKPEVNFIPAFDFSAFPNYDGIASFVDFGNTRSAYENDQNHNSVGTGPFWYIVTNSSSGKNLPPHPAANAVGDVFEGHRPLAWNSTAPSGEAFATANRATKNATSQYPDDIYDITIRVSDLQGNQTPKTVTVVLVNWQRTIETDHQVYTSNAVIKATTGVQYRAAKPVNLYIVPGQGLVGTNLSSGTALPALDKKATATTDGEGVIPETNLGMMPTGVYCVVADYNGDGEYTEGLDAYTVIVVVGPPDPRMPLFPAYLSLSSDLNSSHFTQEVTFTATATLYLPQAAPAQLFTVYFYDGSAFLGSGYTSMSGEAFFVTSDLAIGDHDIRAYLLPYAAGEVSASLAQTVLENPSAVTISSGANSSYSGDAVTFTVLVIPSGTPVTTTPAGTVNLYGRGGYLGSADLDATGGVTFDIDWLALGSQTFRAVYTGDGVYEGSEFSIAHTVLDNAPDLWDDHVTTTDGTAVTVRVLKNDYDPDGDELTIVDVDQSADGYVTSTPTGIIFVPNAGFVGSVRFTYTVSDGHRVSSSARVLVEVLAAGTGTRVFADANGDGVQGAGERGVPLVPVLVLDTGGSVVGFAVTDDNGYYHLPPLPAGNYHLRFVPPDALPALAFAPPDQGTDDATDSDVDAAGETPAFAYDPAQGWPDFDAGIVLDPTDPAFSYLFA